MTSVLKGFPARFPVRDDDRRPLRYRISSLAARVYVRAYFGGGFRIQGADNVPQDGPLLVIANHLSNIDPLLFGGYFPRTLFAMAKREMYALPLAAWWLAGCNCIPVDRGAADRRAVIRALEVLRRRGRLLIFIEGTRSRTGGMQRAEAGVGFLARRSCAVIQPVGIWGTERAGRLRLPGRHRGVSITMRYGVPMTLDLAGRRDDAAIADELATAVAQLLPPPYRGVYSSAAPGPAS